MWLLTILPWGSIGSFALGEFLVQNPECYLLLTHGSVSSSSIEKELDLNVERLNIDGTVSRSTWKLHRDRRIANGNAGALTNEMG